MSGALVQAVLNLPAMHRWSARIATGILSVAALFGASSPIALAAEDRPVVVELFTAQGCSGCPDANATLERVARNPKVVVLTYGVDYWDYLGWRDTFARPEFTERQRGYRQALGLRSVATPQVVIDGQHQLIPRSAPDMDTALAQTGGHSLPPPDIEFRETGDRVAVGSGRLPQGGAEVVAVRYAPGLQTVTVRSGDNQGQSVKHINVVKEIRHLGDWRGRPSLYELPHDLSARALNDDALVVMVQGKADRRILSVARLPELHHD